MKREIRSPLTAIKQHCAQWCENAAMSGGVEECLLDNCPLYAFRLGKNPYRKKQPVVSEEKKRELLRRLKTATEWRPGDHVQRRERPQNGKTRVGR